MKEWYLITCSTKPNSLGGFENQSFNDFKDDAFLETLETDIADTITLYNFNLTSSISIRCIVQGKTADTHLKSLERTFLFPIGTAKAGMYVLFEGVYWLLTGYNGNNKIYEKLTGTLCVYKLRWQNSFGNIIERWITATSAAKYDVGENRNSTLTLTSNTMTIEMPIDNESLELDGKRVFIDIKGSNPTKIYKITRNDDIPFHYGETHGGILSFIADKTEFNPETDNQELRICDYIPPTTLISSEPNESKVLTATISGRSDLKVGYSRNYTVSFTDTDNNEVSDVNFSWNVSDFADQIEQEVDGNTIKLTVENEDLIGESFLLQVIVDDVVNGEMTITIQDIY